MFIISLPNDYKLEGCPESGIEAVDFRRSHGLPEEPSNLIHITNFFIDSEPVARALVAAGLELNGNADYSQPCVKLHTTDTGEICTSRCGDRVAITVPADALASALRDEKSEVHNPTVWVRLALACAQSYNSYHERIESEAAGIRAQIQRVADARALLADELSRKDRRIESLLARVSELESTAPVDAGDAE